MEFQVVAKLVYCRNCGELESWHSAIDGQCPDSGEPHPESELDEDEGKAFGPMVKPDLDGYSGFAR